MLPFKRILFASDFSSSADAALLYAAAVARQTQASLLVLHVLDTRVTALPHWTDIFRSTEVLAAQEATATAAITQLLAHPALAGLSVETLVQQGNPRERIVDTAAYADLVVMGTRGRGGGTSKTPGKTARYVAHGSPAPVLFVPEGGGHAGLPAVGTSDLPFRRILLALHFAQYAPQALVLARALALACRGALEVLQVIEPDKVTAYPLEAGGGLYHNVDAIKILLRQRFAAIVPDDPAGPPVERRILEGNAADMILRQSHESGSDLLVMSVHAYGALQKFFTASTADMILEQTSCPLLTVPFLRPEALSTTLGIGSASAG